MIEAINPLLESVEPMEGQLWIPGNRAIINLNLASKSVTVWKSELFPIFWHAFIWKPESQTITME